MTKGERKLHRTQGLGHDKTISLKVTAAMDQAIPRVADHSQMSKSEWIRNQISQALGGVK